VKNALSKSLKNSVPTCSVGFIVGAISVALSAIMAPSARAANPYMSGQPFEINTTRPTFTLETSTAKQAVASSPVNPVSSNLVNPLNIVINFTGGLTSNQQAIFSQAEATWESLLVGYKPGISIPQVTINASGVTIDGAGDILGQAGPTFGTVQSGFALTTEGVMEFDSADLANLEAANLLDEVILHEMAHVLGFGTLWDGPSLGSFFAGTQQVSIAGTGRYTGTAALNAWRNEFTGPGAGLSALFVPVEQGGGDGTRDVHWNEVDGGSGLTGIVNGAGQDFQFELMTGWLNPPSAFISNTTVQSFADIGYAPANTAPIPTPALLPGLVGMGISMLRQKRKSADQA
jgi:hypothetical protein